MNYVNPDAQGCVSVDMLTGKAKSHKGYANPVPSFILVIPLRSQKFAKGKRKPHMDFDGSIKKVYRLSKARKSPRRGSFLVSRVGWKMSYHSKCIASH